MKWLDQKDEKLLDEIRRQEQALLDEEMPEEDDGEFAEEDEGEGSQVCKVEWGAASGILLNNTIVWNGGPPSKSSSWNVSLSPTPGEV